MAAAGSGQTLWTSRFAFLMASVGFAVGLGNIWRFPYVAGQNGGSAFVLVYLCCALAIGIPVVMAELMLGRRGKAAPPMAMAAVAAESGRSRQWRWLGGLGLATAWTIQVVYAVVVGWVLWYLFRAVLTGFAGVDAVTATANYDAVRADIRGMLLWTLIGLGITWLIVYAGLQDGVERAVSTLMPLLFVLLLLLAVFNAFSPGFVEAIDWLLSPDFSRVGPETLLAAVAQAFFSIGVGMGAMMTYGAYLPREYSISVSAVVIALVDTLVALLAGLVIFPAVFRFGLDPASGPGLIFETLPVAFAQMPGGHLFSSLFFLMLTAAGITSMVGFSESISAWLKERFALSRHLSATLVVGSVSVFSVLSILSYNVLGSLRLGGRNFNELFSFLSDQVMLPVGGLLIAVFAGWFMHREYSQNEFATLSEPAYALWRFLIRYLVPPALFLIFVLGIME